MEALLVPGEFTAEKLTGTIFQKAQYNLDKFDGLFNSRYASQWMMCQVEVRCIPWWLVARWVAQDAASLSFISNLSLFLPPWQLIFHSDTRLNKFMTKQLMAKPLGLLPFQTRKTSPFSM